LFVWAEIKSGNPPHRKLFYFDLSQTDVTGLINSGVTIQRGRIKISRIFIPTGEIQEFHQGDWIDPKNQTQSNQAWQFIRDSQKGDDVEYFISQVERIIDDAPQPPLIPVPKQNWISISQGIWNLSMDRVTGEAIFIIDKDFDPYYYKRNLTLVTQIKDEVGKIIVIKNNNLWFTETERDERITWNEGAFGNKKVTVLMQVLNENNQSFTFEKEFTLNEEDDPTVPEPGRTGDKYNEFIKALPLMGIGLLFLNRGARFSK